MYDFRQGWRWICLWSTNARGHRCRRKPRFKKSEKHRRRLRCTTLFVLLLVLSPPRRTVLVLVLVLVLEAIQYSNPAYWSASSRELPRLTIGIAEVKTAIEYEYRFTEYRPPRRTEYEYDEIRGEARNDGHNRARASPVSIAKTPDRDLRFTALLSAIKASRTLLGIGLPVPGASL